MTIAHRATDGFRGDRRPLCGAAPTRWAADAIDCTECERLHAEKTATGGYKPATQDEVDKAMHVSGFEAAGNAGELWNRLNPVHGENF